MVLHATIPFVSAREVLLTLELNRLDAVVAIEGDAVGRITTVKGGIVDARAGDLTGLPALARLVAAATGTLRVEPFVEPAARTIQEESPVRLGDAPEGAPAEVEGTVTGNGVVLQALHALELLYFNGRAGRLVFAGGEVTVAGGTLVTATAGGKAGDQALHAMIDSGAVPFTLSPAPGATPVPESPLHVSLVAAIEMYNDNLRLRSRAEIDDSERLQPVLADLAAKRLHDDVRLALAHRLMHGLDVAPYEVVTRLCLDAHPGVRAAAKRTVEGLDVGILVALVANPATPGPLVGHLIETFPDDAVLLEAAVAHPLLEEAVAVRIAEMADPNVAEALLKSKWGAVPAVRDAMSRDSNTTVRRTRRATEASRSLSDLPSSSLPEPKTKVRKVAKRKNPGQLSLRDQILLAGSGNMRQQLELACSPTQMVACAVIASPRMSDSMAMSIAQLTTANGEALRELAANKRYSNQYSVARMLAFNPKTPPGSVIDLLDRLSDNDLKTLSKGSFAEPVKQAAIRKLAIREQKKKFV